MSKCPKCERTVSSITVEPIDLKSGNKSWKGAAYSCPHCQSILSAGFDTLLVIDDIATKVVGKLHN